MLEGCLCLCTVLKGPRCLEGSVERLSQPFIALYLTVSNPPNKSEGARKFLAICVRQIGSSLLAGHALCLVLLQIRRGGRTTKTSTNNSPNKKPNDLSSFNCSHSV